MHMDVVVVEAVQQRAAATVDDVVALHRADVGGHRRDRTLANAHAHHPARHLDIPQHEISTAMFGAHGPSLPALHLDRPSGDTIPFRFEIAEDRVLNAQRRGATLAVTTNPAGPGGSRPGSPNTFDRV